MRFLRYVKCFLLDNVTCGSVWSPLDDFIGCIMLYFCLLTEGGQWIIATIKKWLQGSLLLSSYLLVHPVPCMSSCLLSLKMSKSWDKSIFGKFASTSFVIYGRLDCWTQYVYIEAHGDSSVGRDSSRGYFLVTLILCGHVRMNYGSRKLYSSRRDGSLRVVSPSSLPRLSNI